MRWGGEGEGQCCWPLPLWSLKMVVARGGGGKGWRKQSGTLRCHHDGGDRRDGVGGVRPANWFWFFIFSDISKWILLVNQHW